MNMSFFKSVMPVDSVIETVKDSFLSIMQEISSLKKCESFFYTLSSEGYFSNYKTGDNIERLQVRTIAELVISDNLMNMLKMVKMDEKVKDFEETVNIFFNSLSGENTVVYVFLSNCEPVFKVVSEGKVTEVDFFGQLKTELKKELAM